jgi:hypothetical protein
MTHTWEEQTPLYGCLSCAYIMKCRIFFQPLQFQVVGWHTIDAHFALYINGMQSRDFLNPSGHGCPILVWMLSLNRDITTEVSDILPTELQQCGSNAFCFKEYDKCYNLVKECAPHTALPYAPTSVDSFRELS